MSGPLLSRREGNCQVLTFNAPARKNALSMEMRAELYDALLAAEQDAGVRCVVITGAEGTFCAGGDIGQMNETQLASARTRMRRNTRLVQQMLTMGKPLIAAVEGWAVGAGFSLAMACDTVIAADNARFQSGFGKVGLAADLGLFHTLPSRVGMARARQILMYNQRLEAAEALSLGVVDSMVEAGQSLRAALQQAEALNDQAPLAVAATKAMLAGQLEWAFTREVDWQSQLLISADHQEGKAAFAEKRAPRFGGN